MQVQLILEEVLLNAMTHGLGRRADGHIELTIDQAGGQVDIEVVDNGIAFDPLAHPEPDINAAVEDREIGGLGIHFMRTIMDTVSYERVGELNRLRMGKRLVAGEA
jgi:serine/threonine-protein kinase RsbW